MFGEEEKNVSISLPNISFLENGQFISPFCWNAIQSITVPNFDVYNTIFCSKKCLQYNILQWKEK